MESAKAQTQRGRFLSWEVSRKPGLTVQSGARHFAWIPTRSRPRATSRMIPSIPASFARRVRSLRSGPLYPIAMNSDIDSPSTNTSPVLTTAASKSSATACSISLIWAAICSECVRIPPAKPPPTKRVLTCTTRTQPRLAAMLDRADSVAGTCVSGDSHSANLTYTLSGDTTEECQ